MADALNKMLFVSLLTALLSVSIGILLLFQSAQPEPYLDEVFHIPQAQKYCDFKFSEWDPKITTLPGLYLVSFVLLRIMAFVTRIQVHVLCSVFWLRFTNVLFMFGNAWILRKILLSVHNGKPKVGGLKGQDKSTQEDGLTNIQYSLIALNLCTFPVLYFFTFLYYTDAGSTFFVLLMYYLSIKKQHTLASFIGVIATIFRQTNIIWVVFVAGTTAVRTLKPLVDHHLKDDPNKSLKELPYYAKMFFENFALMLSILIKYGLVVIGFVIFVYINQGIVVGDRSSHEACLNIPQLFYFLAFTLVLSSPFLLLVDDIFEFLSFLRKILTKPLFLLALLVTLVITCGIIHRFTYVHKYLLADNRHYPFYIWRKVYARHWSIKFLLIPVYFYAGHAVTAKLSSTQPLTWQLIFWTCVSLVTVPQKLFEFRYFIVPYLIYRVHIPLTSHLRIFLEFVLYVIINVVTVYVFLNKPFYWSHEPTAVQRFMW